mgnify:FL=1
MRKPDWVVTTCGKTKLPHPAPASELYSGPFAQSQIKAARSLRPGKGHLILSAKYGYLKASEIVSPYDVRWGSSEAIADDVLSDQIASLGVAQGDSVVHLGGLAYAERSLRLMPEGVGVYWIPSLLGSRGMGNQIRLYKTIQMTRNLPSGWEKTLLTV